MTDLEGRIEKPVCVINFVDEEVSFCFMKPLHRVWRRIMSGNKVVQPKWFQPESHGEKRVLKLYNSLTRKKDVFIPQSGGRLVTWYSCGPTVYDASHMGHARNYVSIDINRRILSDYFGYNVKFVQNVTDIDDKIIIGARQNYLFDKFVENNSKKDVITEVEEALKEYMVNNLKSANETVVTVEQFETWYGGVDVAEEKGKDPKFVMHVAAIEKAIVGLRNVESDNFFSNVRDIMKPFLDRKEGSTINDPEVFRKLPAYWEQRFDDDMRKLNVVPPSITTRVSEYVPEIVKFVSTIIENGYAYATDDGSVYFDTVKFDKSDRHVYAKNQPWNKGHLDLIKEGEGSLSGNFGGKKSSSDFALWKASKPGEPRWESPWGLGRPGWHIECSVMASDILGKSMDIHSGGIDLAFPHHDNELAQSEACFDNEQWVNYFLHTGHLHIEGQKMSKSLKNFITIEEALSKYSARQLRLAFASAQWNSQLDFKESLLSEVKNLETIFSNFFNNVRALKGDCESYSAKKLGEHERDLIDVLEEIEEKVDISFCDNLSTPQVLKSLSELVSSSNLYISKVGGDLRFEILEDVSRFVCRILGVIGIPMRADGLGWYDEEKSGVVNRDEIILPYVKCISNFRDEVRSLAIEKSESSNYLELTDRIRDNDLVQLNVCLDDRNGRAALVKIINDEEKKKLMSDNEIELENRKKREADNLAKKLLKESKEQERLAKAKISPRDMFKNESLYSEWDADGIPTKDASGNEITKSMSKRLKKQWLQQEKLFNSVKPK